MHQAQPDSPGAPAPTPTPAPGVAVQGARLAHDGETLFDHLDLMLPGGQWTCLLGPSGVGKSTLVRLVAGLAPPGAGGRVMAADGGPLAGRLAWMDQRDLLMPWLTVRDNLLIGQRLRGRRPEREAALAMLRRVGLEGLAGRRPHGLSGGQRQRVALARTLMEDRPVVLMDEPFSALDAITRLRLQEQAAALLAGRTVLLVTHDPLEALRLGHRIHVMAGRPARLDRALELPGTPPRDVRDSDLLAHQGGLLDRLAHAGRETRA